jgi:hypothetical protein
MNHWHQDYGNAEECDSDTESLILTSLGYPILGVAAEVQTYFKRATYFNGLRLYTVLCLRAAQYKLCKEQPKHDKWVSVTTTWGVLR